jgi:hypothetical protein
VLPDDGAWRPKHVGAIDGWKINNINKIWWICWFVL